MKRFNKPGINKSTSVIPANLSGHVLLGGRKSKIQQIKPLGSAEAILHKHSYCHFYEIKDSRIH